MLGKVEHNILSTENGWHEQFTPIKQEYSSFISKLSQSGGDEDDEDLYTTTEFFEQMHELEMDNARHSPPAVCSMDAVSAITKSPMSRSRKRAKLSHTLLLKNLSNCKNNVISSLLVSYSGL